MIPLSEQRHTALETVYDVNASTTDRVEAWNFLSNQLEKLDNYESEAK